MTATGSRACIRAAATKEKRLRSLRTGSSIMCQENMAKAVVASARESKDNSYACMRGPQGNDGLLERVSVEIDAVKSSRLYEKTAAWADR